MPKNTVKEAAAAKAKKQKIILVVGGVLLAALFALQGPKLLNHGGGKAASPSPSTTGAAVSETPVAASTAPAAIPAVVPSGKTLAVVAGVPFGGAAKVTAASNQLVSFTLFEVKDPFVPQDGSTTSSTSEQPPPDTQTGGSAPADSNGGSAAGQGGSGDNGGSGSGSSGAAAKPAAPAPPVVYATIEFDGKAQQVEVKDKFPSDDPTFVLKSLKKKSAKIAVAGGSFDDSDTFTLKLHKKVALVNTATGVRYEIELVYTGATPEASFTTTPTGANESTGTQQDTTSSTNGG